MSVFRQSAFVPKPTLTEKNCPDQKGRIHIITGGYGGVGFELSKTLYAHNATLYIAGRSAQKSSSAICQLKQLFPASTGTVESLTVDFSDLATIKPAAVTFLSSQTRLDGLVLNHGVMWTPKGSKSAQGYDLQLATNCLGSYLFYKLLRPALVASGQASNLPARVTWASSLTFDGQSPKPGGIIFTTPSSPDDIPAPRQDLSPKTQYAQTKAGNAFFASTLARHDRNDKILHLSFNPGNLSTDLSRHMPKALTWVMKKTMLHEPRFGGYTELWALLADVKLEESGSYVAPWGRIERLNRKDLREALGDESENGVGEKFVRWAERETAKFM